jgi:hypothetical protein
VAGVNRIAIRSALVNAHDHAVMQREALLIVATRPWAEAWASATAATTAGFASKAMTGIDGYGKDSRTVRSLSRVGASPG